MLRRTSTILAYVDNLQMYQKVNPDLFFGNLVSAEPEK